MALTSMASEAVGGHITLGLKNSLKEAYFSGPTQMQSNSLTSKLLTSVGVRGCWRPRIHGKVLDRVFNPKNDLSLVFFKY